MQVPSSLPALWAQRKRWARGQGEVLRVHLREVCRWRNHRMWLLGLESVASLIWVFCLVAVAAHRCCIGVRLGGEDVFGVALAWGMAIAIVATVQLIVAVWLRMATTTGRARDAARPALPAAVLDGLRAAALRSEMIALIRGPREQRVVWDIPREPVDAGVAPREPS